MWTKKTTQTDDTSPVVVYFPFIKTLVHVLIDRAVVITAAHYALRTAHTFAPWGISIGASFDLEPIRVYS